MLDAQGIHTLYDQVHNLWVEPELAKRRQSGSLPKDFTIRRCLIKLPKDADPVVEFNDEVVWHAKVKTAKGLEFAKDQTVYLHQVEYIETVEPPTHNGVRVAFFFLYWNGASWQLLLDCTPNSVGSEYEPKEGDAWELGRSIADYLNLILSEYAIHNHDAVHAEVESISLWAAPALIPYPLSAICDLCTRGQHADARVLLVEHCNGEFLARIVENWDAVPVFLDRKQLFTEALAAHISGQHTLSISSLLPHLEGVMTDWIHCQLPPSDIPWRQESKTKKFRDVVAAGAHRTFVDQRVADSVVTFILDGPVLSTFTDWLSPPSNSFPNRHVVGHGRYDSSLYTEENSIKCFLYSILCIK